MKVILDSNGDLIGQARVARLALDAGPPEDGQRFRLYGTTGDGCVKAHYAVKYNKASVTVYPQPTLPQREAAE